MDCRKSCDGGGGIKFSEVLVDSFFCIIPVGGACHGRLSSAFPGLRWGWGNKRGGGVSWGICKVPPLGQVVLWD